mgnify:FL=1
MSAIMPFVPLFIRELGVTNFNDTAQWSGFVFAGPFLVSFFMAPVWGMLGDKKGRKLMTLRAAFGLGAAQLLLALSQNVYQLFIFRILQGTVSGFYPATIALIAANTPKERTGYALSMIQAASTSGTIIGPLIGGGLAALFGYRGVFVIVGISIILTGFLVMLFVKEEHIPNPEENHSTILDNWREGITNKKLLIPLILILMTTLPISLVQPVFVLFIETFNVPEHLLPTVTGALFSVIGIFSAISSSLIGKRLDGGRLVQVLFLGSLVVGVTQLLHSIISNVYWLIPLRVLQGLGFGVLLPSLFTLMNKQIPDERKGGILGVASSFQILGILGGSLFAGSLVEAVGIKNTFTFAGALFILFSFVVLKYLRKSEEKKL